MSVNKFIGIGNLGKDPEVRFLSDGKSVTNAAIAISEKYKDKSGEQKEVTEWVNLVFFGRLAEIAGEYLKKGSMIYVEGKLKTESYEKDGQKRYSTKVVCDTMKMLNRVGEQKPTEGKDKFDDTDIPF